MEKKWLENVTEDDVVKYLESMGYDQQIFVKKRNDRIGDTVYMKGVQTNSNGEIKDLCVEMGEYVPRVYRERVVVSENKYAGKVMADFWDHNFDAVCQKDEDGKVVVPEYISRWWEMVASKNPGSTYLADTYNAYKEYCRNLPYVNVRKLETVRNVIIDLMEKLNKIAPADTSEDDCTM